MAGSKRFDIAASANRIRHVFDNLADKIAPVGVITVVAVATGLFMLVVKKLEQYFCGEVPVRIVDLELTFSALRYETLLNHLPAPGCRNLVMWSFVSTDAIFPIIYATALTALYVWLERYRRRGVDERVKPEPLPQRNHVFVLLPLVAALVDILIENIPLWAAALLITHTSIGAKTVLTNFLVVFGSLGAALKWALLLVTALAMVAELYGGSRGVMLRRLRFSVLAVLVGGFPLLLIPQGQDILQRLVEGDHPWTRIIAALFALTFGAAAVWYCGRKLAEMRFTSDPPAADAGWEDFFTEHVPRMLGIAVLALAGAAFSRAGDALGWFAGAALIGYAAAAFANKYHASKLGKLGAPFIRGYWKEIARLDERVGRVVLGSIIGLIAIGYWPFGSERLPLDFLRLRWASWLCLLVAWLFYLYVYTRRERIAARNFSHTVLPVVAEQLKNNPARGAIDFHRDIYSYELLHLEHSAVRRKDARSIGRGLKLGLAAGFVASLIALIAFTLWPVDAGRALGPLVVLTLAVISVVFYGSIAAWAFGAYRIPVATILLVFAALFSSWNDSHIIRTFPPNAASITSRPDIATHFASWARPDVDSVERPVILVAAAGGGLRAAYWTAASLAALQDRNPEFGRHIFAISGVSGGSLGAAVFTAMMRDAGRKSRLSPCESDAPRDTLAIRTFGAYSACVRDFMRDDFLSPVLAKMVAPDLLQWFLPFPVPQFDRSLGLEGGWERSYATTMKDSTMRQGLLTLVGDTASRSYVPALFLNATHVESGRRYVASPLVRRGQSLRPGDSSRALRDSRDLLDVLGSDLPLSTAVGNTARFTYVSPPGRIERADGKEYGHLVDGGYFENSGLGTLREVLEIVLESGAASSMKQRPVVLYLCNDPLACRRDASEDTVLTTKRSAIVEWAGPIRALFRTRDARGSLARADIAQRRDIRFVQLSVCDSLVSRGKSKGDTTLLGSKRRERLAEERVIAPPLGWLLSKLARDWMDSSLTGGDTSSSPSRCRKDNAAALEMLSSLLTPAKAPFAQSAETAQEASQILR
ncbi:MAG TPA: hypothetical protein VM939_08270 [Gemmatimonadaceae bacterium]|nr:hypothetical protein [Gemmatimonadaceae bacterium]